MEPKEKKTAKKDRSSYSNSYRSLEAIWTVLKQHSSKAHPLTVQEICEYLKQMNDIAQKFIHVSNLLLTSDYYANCE